MSNSYNLKTSNNQDLINLAPNSYVYYHSQSSCNYNTHSFDKSKNFNACDSKYHIKFFDENANSNFSSFSVISISLLVSDTKINDLCLY